VTISRQRPSGDDPVTWTTLVIGRRRADQDTVVSPRHVVLQVSMAAAAVLVLVGLLGVLIVQRIAERESVHDAAELTDQLARTIVMPAVEEGLVTGDALALHRFDTAVRNQVLDETIIRVKVWKPDGTIVYSDEPGLIGRTFRLRPEAGEAFTTATTIAELSNLTRPENSFERGQGPLLEVYRPIWTPDSHQPLLFETYARADRVTSRATELWRAFGGIVISTLLLFIVLMLPLLWALLDRLRRAQSQREVLLQHAIDASEDERRRIAADLHDGVVQDLIATSLVIAGAAESPPGRPGEPLPEGPTGESPEPSPPSAEQLDRVAKMQAAAAAMRGAVGSLRTLLVDIYPPNLHSAGLGPALVDLGAGLRARGVDVLVDVDPDATRALTEDEERLIYRMARECLRNMAKHARADQAWLTLHRMDDLVVLDVVDDGIGLDPQTVARAQSGGHLGLRLLADLAQEHGSALKLATGPGEGTRWRLEVPVR